MTKRGLCAIMLPNLKVEEFIMAYMTKKKIKGITYYYAEHREWKEGKSRRKWQKYLGTIDKIIKAVDGKDQKPECAIVFQLGGVAAYLDIAREIDLVKTIDSMLPKRKQGISIGEYLLIVVINRGLDAVSKRSMWNWFEDTILLNYMSHVKKDTLSSQRFWDNMCLIKEDKIPQIWLNIIDNAITRYNVDLSHVSYDGTNFYTFISTFNYRCNIAKRGKNKQGRSNLRQVNYALFCSKEDHIPLFFDVYDGNTHDSKEFFKIIPKFKEAFSRRIGEEARITIIFDKGNNSLDNIKQIDQSPFNFVASVKLDEHKDLALISNKDSKLKSVEHPKLEEIKAYRIKKKIYGKERTVIVTFNNNLYCDQLSTISNDIGKCLQKLSTLSQRLKDRSNELIKKGKKPTMSSVKKAVNEVLKRQYMKNLIKIEYQQKNDIPLITSIMDIDEFTILTDTYLGKKIIFTDNHDWSTDDIILAYHSQYVIENAFKETKSRKIGCWWPMYHYTDQKIKVHGLYCSLTLLVRSLISREARLQKVDLSIERMHNKLSGIKEVLNIYPKEKGKGVKKIKRNSTLTKMDEIQKKLFEIFKMKEYISS